MYYGFFARDYDAVLFLNVCRYYDFIVNYLLRIIISHIKAARLVLGWTIHLSSVTTARENETLLFFDFEWW